MQSPASASPPPRPRGRLQTPRQNLYRIFAGRAVPTLEWLHQAATALGIDPHELDARLNPARRRK